MTTNNTTKKYKCVDCGEELQINTTAEGGYFTNGNFVGSPNSPHGVQAKCTECIEEEEVLK